jgi:hypothetical protein
MPVNRVWLLAAVFFIPRLVHAGGDVSFQLDAQVTVLNVDSESLTRESIEFQDRAWAVPGMEQASQSLPAAKTFNFASNSGPHFRFAGDGPTWLDDVCFPLTRQLFHQCNETNPRFATVLCESSYIPRIEQQKIFLAH